MAAEGEAEPKLDSGTKFTLGPSDTLEGKLNHDGSLRVRGSRGGRTARDRSHLD